MARLIVLLASMLALVCAAPAGAAFEAADRTEEWLDTPDGQTLHAEVLRPKGLPEGARTPVILIVSPYLGHAVEGSPSTRFADFIDGARVFDQGYSVVMVDLRGTGGSTGCLDILGPGEQTDIVTAVQWAASQPWSTGKVGMYGKSYDANTGMAAGALRPPGLAAVVAQQVVPDRYRGSYSGGVRYLQSVAYPSASYGSQGELGFTEQDTPEYVLNSVAHSADCQIFLAGHYNPDETTAFWRDRDFVEMAAGSTVPVLMTTGFLDTNTNIGGGAIDYFNALAGPKRLWLGWWDHVRGNDKVGERLAMGRAGWYDEVMRFYDSHLKGQAVPDDPEVEIQGSDGRWRTEAAWPPADASVFRAPLRSGSYVDDGRNQGSGDAAAGAGGSGAAPEGTGFGAGVWTVSPPLPHEVHLAGIPAVTVGVEPVVPQTNLVVNLYDVAPDGAATMISRGARLVSESGDAAVDMYPTEWKLGPGHRIAVLVSGSNNEAWVHVPTRTTVDVTGGEIALPVLAHPRASDLDGEPAPRLETFKADAPFPVSADLLSESTEPALVPPAQVPWPFPAAPEPGSGTMPAAGSPPAAVAAPAGSITARLRVRRGLARVSGRAPAGARVSVRLRRGRRTIARRTAVARGGAYSVRIRVRGPRRRLSAVVTTRVTGGVLRAVAR